MPNVPYPYEVNGKLVTGNGSLIPISSLSNRSLLPSLTVFEFLRIRVLTRNRRNYVLQSNLIRNKLVLRNHFPWPICHLLHKDKEHLALRNNFRTTRKFLIAKFDCITINIIMSVMIFQNVTFVQLDWSNFLSYLQELWNWRCNNPSRFLHK